ncbi:rhomboid family intramembrane serine protease [Ottowia testudinis]|uniref:Peptidase S54 rhomboid domain-containing protein n=1 Tax=Ottowia testudinis TaxID=2816950 RepID=A0A975CGZ4_9BURK|nr:rhomboid family intramembrane serine protease [Ottowia testudinis]QTD45597.1 hypothetical protein J1M35_01335 [Ottowia testudinis]
MSSRAWPFACLLLIAASAAVWLLAASDAVPPERLIWRYDGWRQQPWTLWTGPLLHLVLPHAVANGLALAALAVLGTALRAPPRDALALLLAWPLATWALVLVPGVGASYGLAGAVHAAAAILAVRTLQQADTRVLGLLLAGGLLIKLRLERGWAVPIAFDSGWAFNVIYAAHLTGAAAGAVLALTLEALHRLFRRRPPPPAAD